MFSKQDVISQKPHNTDLLGDSLDNKNTNKFDFQSHKLVKIIAPVPFDNTYTYKVLKDENIARGNVVKINFANKDVYGLVWEVLEDEKEIQDFFDNGEGQKIKPSKLKNVTQIIDIPFFSEEFLKLIKKVSDYNLVPLGSLVKVLLSPVDLLESEHQITSYKLTEDYISKIGDITKRQKEVTDFLSKNSQQLYSQKELYGTLGVTSGVIKKLVEKEIIETTKITENTFNQNINPRDFQLHQLSDKQLECYDFLKNKISDNKYSTTLLEGVTGSGKTEVFFHLIADILKKVNNTLTELVEVDEGNRKTLRQAQGTVVNNKTNTKQILILLPEIVLTSQLISRFKKQFNFEPAIWHSMISKTKKRDIFKGIVDGSIKVIIGTRSALLLPYKNLGLVVVDEEHEASFKQVDIISYNGRDMAIMRAATENFPIILSSATPSIETLANVESGKYSMVHLPSRFGVAEKPAIELTDMRNEKLEKGNFISSQLLREIKNTLEQGKQAMLYLNRRGYAPVVLCNSCGAKLECPNCSITLTQHKELGKLVCHHCGFFTEKPSICPKCQEKDSLISFGPGVERIKEEVETKFPDARVSLMTSDTIKNVNDAEKAVQEISDGKIDIIIGTQMIAKGHHFPALTLVGILDADAGLYGGDPRASERTYQLLTQVAGRAGREADKGKVFIQTFSPDNITLQTIVSADKETFTQFEMQGRELANLPPFGRMIALIVSGIYEQNVVNISRSIIQKLPVSDRVTIFGPSPAPITRVNNRYRYRILVSSDKSLNLQKLVKSALQNLKTPKDVRIKVDVDPYSFL